MPDRNLLIPNSHLKDQLQQLQSRNQTYLIHGYMIYTRITILKLLESRGLQREETPLVQDEAIIYFPRLG